MWLAFTFIAVGFFFCCCGTACVCATWCYTTGQTIASKFTVASGTWNLDGDYISTDSSSGLILSTVDVADGQEYVFGWGVFDKALVFSEPTPGIDLAESPLRAILNYQDANNYIYIPYSYLAVGSNYYEGITPVAVVAGVETELKRINWDHAAFDGTMDRYYNSGVATRFGVCVTQEVVEINAWAPAGVNYTVRFHNTVTPGGKCGFQVVGNTGTVQLEAQSRLVPNAGSNYGIRIAYPELFRPTTGGGECDVCEACEQIFAEGLPSTIDIAFNADAISEPKLTGFNGTTVTVEPIDISACNGVLLRDPDVTEWSKVACVYAYVGDVETEAVGYSPFTVDRQRIVLFGFDGRFESGDLFARLAVVCLEAGVGSLPTFDDAQGCDETGEPGVVGFQNPILYAEKDITADYGSFLDDLVFDSGDYYTAGWNDPNITFTA